MLFKSDAEMVAVCGQQAAQEAIEEQYVDPTEERITGSFTTKYSDKINNSVDLGHYRVYSSEFRSDYVNSPETLYGADFMVIVGVLNRYGATGCGIMSQAKFKKMHHRDPVDSLQSDCKLMLDHSPSSYVTMYYRDEDELSGDKAGFRFWSANRILNIDADRFKAEGSDLRYQIPNVKTRNFFGPLLRGVSGDEYIYYNFEKLLNTKDFSLSGGRRGLYTDGGEESLPYKPVHALVMIFEEHGNEEQREYDPYDELPFDESRISELGIE